MRLIFCLIFFYSSLFSGNLPTNTTRVSYEGKSINELPEPTDISQLLADKSMEDSFKDTERSDAQNSEEAKKNNISMIFLGKGADLEIEETKEYSAQTRNQGFSALLHE